MFGDSISSAKNIILIGYQVVFVSILLMLCQKTKKSQTTTNCSATSLKLAQNQQQPQQQQVLTQKSSFIVDTEKETDVEKKKREEKEKLEKDKEKKRKEDEKKEDEKGKGGSRRDEKGEGDDDVKYDDDGNIQPKHEKTVRIELSDDPSKTHSTRTHEAQKVQERLSDIGLVEKDVSEVERKAAKDPSQDPKLAVQKKARTMSPTARKSEDDKLDVTQEHCPEKTFVMRSQKSRSIHKILATPPNSKYHAKMRKIKAALASPDSVVQIIATISKPIKNATKI